MIKTKDEIEKMRQGGKILGQVLKQLAKEVKPGTSTKALNTQAEELIKQAGARPAFKGYSMSGLKPFPCALCTSINEEVVHGLAVPEKILKEGDIVGLDLGLIYQNMYLDSAITVPVGKISKEAKQLISMTKKALELGIKQVKLGNTTGDIGFVVQEYVEKKGLSVIRELVGHGVGKSVHEPPQIPNYGSKGTGEALKPGMTIAIEPMVALGDWRLKFSANDWPVNTKDGSLSAHFEHTVLVTDKGHEILTLP
jgi:methionyl aminopeptidase